MKMNFDDPIRDGVATVVVMAILIYLISKIY